MVVRQVVAVCALTVAVVILVSMPASPSELLRPPLTERSVVGVIADGGKDDGRIAAVRATCWHALTLNVFAHCHHGRVGKLVNLLI